VNSEKCGLGVSPVLSFSYSGGTPVGGSPLPQENKNAAMEHLFKKVDGLLVCNGSVNGYEEVVRTVLSHLLLFRFDLI
jgi:hypothetical protein